MLYTSHFVRIRPRALALGNSKAEHHAAILAFGPYALAHQLHYLLRYCKAKARAFACMRPVRLIEPLKQMVYVRFGYFAGVGYAYGVL